MKKDSKTNLLSQTRLATALVAGFGFLLGYFLWQTFLLPHPQKHVLDYSKSAAIMHPQSSPRAFFRKTFYLPIKARHAWLAATASESFILYINGKPFDPVLSLEVIATGLYDLTDFLSPGKNIVAVEVFRSSYPGPAWVKVSLGYTLGEGQNYSLYSDGSWRTSLLDDNLVREKTPLYWYDPQFDDVAWPRARIHEGELSLTYPALVETWPLIYATPPEGQWFWGPGALPREMVFRRTLNLPKGTNSQVALRISGLCPYRVSLNGETVAQRSSPASLFDLYDLRPLLKGGDNQLSLEIKRLPGKVGVLAEIFVKMADKPAEVIRDVGGWRVMPASVQEPEPLPVSLAPYPSFPGYPMPQKPGRLILPWWYSWWYGGSLGLCLAATACLAWGHWRLWAVIWRRPHPTPRTLLHLAYFHLPAMLFLITVLLMGFDIRYHPDFPFQSWIILAALVILEGGQVVGGLLPSDERE